MADPLTPEREAEIREHIERLRSLASAEGVSTVTVPDRRDLKALAALAAVMPELLDELAETKREREQYRTSLPAEVQDYWYWRKRAELAEARRCRLIEQVQQVLESARWALATSADDWGATFGKAWLYGIFVGWGCEEDHEHDEVCGGDGALDDLVARGVIWPRRAVEKLRSLRATVRALDGEEAGR